MILNTTQTPRKLRASNSSADLVNGEASHGETTDDSEEEFSDEEVESALNRPQLGRRGSPAKFPALTPRKVAMTPRRSAHHCLLVVHGNSGFGKVCFNSYLV